MRVRMREERSFHEELLDNLPDGVLVVDRDLRIAYWNHGAEQLTGYRRAEMIGRRCCDTGMGHGERLGGGASPDTECPLRLTLADGNPRQAAVYVRHHDGRRIPILARVSPIRTSGGEIVGAAQIFSDNSSMAAVLERLAELQKLALIDPLTEMGNRRFVEMHLNARFDALLRYGWPFGILFIDIDYFKAINDHHGHATGDLVLQTVGRTLSNAVRSFDVVGRWGGDEFVAVVVNVTEDQLWAIANKLRYLVEQAHPIGTERIRVTVSVGAALARTIDTIESLVRRADEDMYHGKLAGRTSPIILTK